MVEKVEGFKRSPSRLCGGNPTWNMQWAIWWLQNACHRNLQNWSLSTVASLFFPEKCWRHSMFPMLWCSTQIRFLKGNSSSAEEACRGQITAASSYEPSRRDRQSFSSAWYDFDENEIKSWWVQRTRQDGLMEMFTWLDVELGQNIMRKVSKRQRTLDSGQQNPY